VTPSDNKYLSRKFILAMIFTCAACLALFITEKLDGGQFVTLALGIVTAFNASDVADKFIERRQEPAE
jgi:uncharacterized membrane protein YeaQ/YmgE (transglycosylase-associated protein family)